VVDGWPKVRFGLGIKLLFMIAMQVSVSMAITQDAVSEMYLEDRDKKNSIRQKPLVSPSPIEMPIQEMIDRIVRAGYVVMKSDCRGGSG
jgi:hypothetical protein